MAESKVIISGEIGMFGTSPVDVREQLAAAAGEDIDVQISSPGGFVFDGIEIYNMIRDYKRDNPGAQITITLKGEAASMASYIAANPAADMVVAEDNAVFMIHNPWDIAIGDYRDMEKSSEILRGIGSLLSRAYANRSGKSPEEIRSLMDAETFYFGEEIKAAGFVDEIIGMPEGERVEREDAVAQSRIRIAAMQEKMQKDERAKADIQKAAALLIGFKAENISQAIPEESSPEKSNGGRIMAEEEKNLTADDITFDWLMANKPDVVEAIKNAATEEEKERQQEIDEAEENEEDDSEEAKALFKAARYGDRPMGVGDVLKELSRMRAERKKRLLADRKEDADDVPAVNQQGHEDQQGINKFMVNHMKSLRRVK